MNLLGIYIQFCSISKARGLCKYMFEFGSKGIFILPTFGCTRYTRYCMNCMQRKKKIYYCDKIFQVIVLIFLNDKHFSDHLRENENRPMVIFLNGFDPGNSLRDWKQLERLTGYVTLVQIIMKFLDHIITILFKSL
ncbi:hypothetical protein RCL_jg3245.t1 [Rhizophagus clarus]|uniref:Uncharacterized protein n=1 Tax=Rhizophagus clarus TaxID=94130 RepID=A0A8H3M728_9GLOM|nr:hypothetical protein RCL_jg3245.t1 [Rhizophagus clarus]